MSHSIKLLASLVSILAVSACTQTWMIYDAQVSSGVERRPAGGCAAPWSRYSLTLPSEIKISIEVSASRNVTWKNESFPSVIFFSVGVTLPKDQTVKFEDPIFRISSPELPNTVEAALASFDLPVYGLMGGPRGYKLTFAPSDELVGGHQINHDLIDRFGSTFYLRGVIPKTITVEFPSFLVNGDRVKPPPITFVYREESHFATCISF